MKTQGGLQKFTYQYTLYCTVYGVKHGLKQVDFSLGNSKIYGYNNIMGSQTLETFKPFEDVFLEK